MASAKNQQMSKSEKKKQAQKSQHENTPDEIKCKICKKRYEDPKLLPCLHTYCKACLKESVKTHNGALYCPVCETEIASSEFSGVDNLPSNLMVSDRLQDLSSRQCNNCEEETANSLCFECSDFLCSDCIEVHKQVCLSENHLVVSTNAFKSPTCAIHAPEALMFSKRCKKLVCRSCDKRNEHLKTPLEEAVDDTQSKINTSLIAAQAKIPILQRKLDEVHDSEKKLESKVKQVNEEIEETFEQILKAVKQRKKDLQEKLGCIHKQKSKELKSKELALQKNLAQVSDSCDFAKDLEKSDNKAMVLHTSELTCARLKDLSKTEDDAVKEIAENGIEYIFEQKLVLDQLEICGDVLLQPNCSELNGTFRCRESGCKTCDFIDSSSFISSPQYTFLIKHHFTCLSSNLIYCISCKKCGKLYIGETGRSLHERFGEHRSAVEKRDQTHGVAKHFTSGGHNFFRDRKIRALCPCPDKDETRPKEKEKRRKQEESRLIDKLGTLNPLIGLNKIP